MSAILICRIMNNYKWARKEVTLMDLSKKLYLRTSRQIISLIHCTAYLLVCLFMLVTYANNLPSNIKGLICDISYINKWYSSYYWVLMKVMTTIQYLLVVYLAMSTKWSRLQRGLTCLSTSWWFPAEKQSALLTDIAQKSAWNLPNVCR